MEFKQNQKLAIAETRRKPLFGEEICQTKRLLAVLIPSTVGPFGFAILIPW
jgi:hypothetical protein